MREFCSAIAAIALTATALEILRVIVTVAGVLLSLAAIVVGAGMSG